MIGANFLVQSKVESTERLKVIVKRVDIRATGE